MNALRNRAPLTTLTILTVFGSAFVPGSSLLADYPCTAYQTWPAPSAPKPGTVCVSASTETTFDEVPRGIRTAPGFRTRVTGRLPGGPIVFDRTVDSAADPLHDTTVLLTLERARWAVARAGSPDTSGPLLLSSSQESVSSLPFELPTVTSPVQSFLTLPDVAVAGRYCLGGLGERAAPSSPIPAPCPAGSEEVSLTAPASVRHMQTRAEVLTRLFLTGPALLTRSHYEVVGTTATSALTVPLVLSAEGLGGASFTSELALTNPGATDATVTYRYVSAFGGASGAATETLPAGRQKVIPDAVAHLRGLGVPVGDSGSRGGTLRVTVEGLSTYGAAAVTARTTTAVPDGRAGVAYAGVPASKLLRFPVTIPGLRQDGLDRSNVAVLNAGAPDDGDITLRLTVVSGDPDDPRSHVLPDVTLPPGGFRQLSGVLSTAGLRNGTVAVERIAGLAPFYAYGVLNDEANGDGSFVEPVRTRPTQRIPRMTLPVVVESADHDTELVLTNLTTTPRALRLELVAPALPGGAVAWSVSLRPNEQQILPGLVQLLRDRGVVSGLPGRTIAGPLFATDVTGDLRGISIAARVATPGGGGRYGLFFAAVPTGAEATTSASLFDLRQSAETRTNLALVNVGSVDASVDTFRIDLFDGATGRKAGSTDVEVPAKGFLQLDAVLARHAPGVAQGYALVTRTAGSNPFLAFATVLDGAEPGKRSGDGAFVAAVVPEVP